MTTEQQHPTPPDTPEANARARAEGQTITFEATGQQYPTREQIKNAVKPEVTWCRGRLTRTISSRVATAPTPSDSAAHARSTGKASLRHATARPTIASTSTRPRSAT